MMDSFSQRIAQIFTNGCQLDYLHDGRLVAHFEISSSYDSCIDELSLTYFLEPMADMDMAEHMVVCFLVFVWIFYLYHLTR